MPGFQDGSLPLVCSATPSKRACCVLCQSRAMNTRILTLVRDMHWCQEKLERTPLPNRRCYPNILLYKKAIVFDKEDAPGSSGSASITLNRLGAGALRSGFVFSR